jgi:hypothetical protein
VTRIAPIHPGARWPTGTAPGWPSARAGAATGTKAAFRGPLHRCIARVIDGRLARARAPETKGPLP